MKKINVLIVDDSRTMQQWLEQVLESDTSIKVVGKASDPYVARDLIKKTNPNVITLDIMMPKMDGMTFLKNLMRLHPMPVVMISSLADKGSVIALEALSLGAIDYLPKPSQAELVDNSHYARNLINVIKNAANSNISALLKTSSLANIEQISYHSNFLKSVLIVVGGSTGGIEAIESILCHLPRTFPPIVIAQHIRPEFSAAFAKRINKLYRLNIKEAIDNEELVPGTAYVAPAGRDLAIKKVKDHYYCKIDNTASIQEHKPSINVLFSSAAHEAGNHAVGILLTGMGDDGAQGAKEIHDAGGVVIVQDKESSVVWGMPGAAVKLNAADYILPLNKIPETLFAVLDDLAKKQRKY